MVIQSLPSTITPSTYEPFRSISYPTRGPSECSLTWKGVFPAAAKLKFFTWGGYFLFFGWVLSVIVSLPGKESEEGMLEEQKQSQ